MSALEFRSDLTEDEVEGELRLEDSSDIEESKEVMDKLPSGPICIFIKPFMYPQLFQLITLDGAFIKSNTFRQLARFLVISFNYRIMWSEAAM